MKKLQLFLLVFFPLFVESSDVTVEEPERLPYAHNATVFNGGTFVVIPQKQRSFKERLADKAEDHITTVLLTLGTNVALYLVNSAFETIMHPENRTLEEVNGVTQQAGNLAVALANIGKIEQILTQQLNAEEDVVVKQAINVQLEKLHQAKIKLSKISSQ